MSDEVLKTIKNTEAWEVTGIPSLAKSRQLFGYAVDSEHVFILKSVMVGWRDIKARKIQIRNTVDNIFDM